MRIFTKFILGVSAMLSASSYREYKKTLEPNEVLSRKTGAIYKIVAGSAAPQNQRQRRLNRRRAHAAGKKGAFA